MKNENLMISDKWKMKVVIVIPCYNEEKILEKNIKEVLDTIKNLPQDIKIVISDNNSKDKTAEIGKQLANENEKIEYILVGQPGKGAAVMEAWKQYDADVYGFMDADLATELEALPLAIKYLSPTQPPPFAKEGGDDASPTSPPPFAKEGGNADGYDIVIGSRRIKGAKAERELYRKFTSAVLNLLVKLLLGTEIKDTACGFKFFKKEALIKILPQIKDRKFVFDTELLIIAERAGFKIKEIPVEWEEKGERGSSVNVYPTAMEYLKKIWVMRKELQ